MTRATLGGGIGLVLLALVAGACRRGEQAAPVDDEAASAPDRLGAGERLPESETAFGLALPPGMRLVRHFKDAAYFSGKLDMQSVVEQVAQQVEPRNVELVGGGALLSRVRVKGDDSGRQLQVEVKKTRLGTLLHVQNITSQAPAVSGLSQEELWRRAGRKPDGTPIDPNQMY